MSDELNREPLDAAFDALRRMPVPERPPDAELLARLATGLSPAAAPLALLRRRMLMRLATGSAAAAVLALAAGVFLLTGSPTAALADVVKAAEKHKLVRYKLKQTTEDKTNGTASGESVVYADLRTPRSRTEDGGLTINGAVDFRSVFVQDGKKDRCLHVITEMITEKGKTDPMLIELLKGFEKLGVPRKEARVTRAFGDFTPATAAKNKSILENLRELEGRKDAVGTKAKLDGKDVLKYRVEDGNQTTVLWVDAATRLPVRLEHEILDHTPNIPRNAWVLSGFEWDPPLKGFKSADELFDTTPPEGYTVIDETKPKADK
jgi:hypothetical protein